MNPLIDAAVSRARPVLLVLVLVLLAGSVAYVTIPKESDPDVAIPIIYVRIAHEGISPGDAERLLVRPMEQELRNIEGLKEMRATAVEGHATLVLEFEAGFDPDQALDDVREQVDVAKAELPEDNEPTVHEVNVALFPIIVVTLYGDVPERALVAQARSLRDKLEGLTGVLEADIAGDREDLVEVLVDPGLLESIDQTPEILLATVARNNQLVAAGAMDTGQGRFPVKVPGLLETAQDMLSLPVVTSGDRVLAFRDVAFARRTFKDPTGFARVGGQPAIALEVSKRIGTNIIDTVADVRELVEQERRAWPPGIQVRFSQDRSEDIRDMLRDLQSNVIAAIVLVMIVVVAALGLRTAGLVGVSIPGSFLTGILVLGFAGLTINIVVLFSLIMAVGMLVDGTIVVVELADRRMAEGYPRRQAYAMAAKRMAWPIVAATATTLAAFMPLLFWPGIIGEFMKYLPITLIATLAASLFMALVFVPTLGGVIGRRAPDSEFEVENLAAAESGDLRRLRGGSGLYLRILRIAVTRPWAVVLLAGGLLTTAYAAYGHWGKGVEFFPDVEPDNAFLHVHARGDLSVHERDRLVREVEQRILGMHEFATIYARSGTRFRSEVSEDTIGIVQLELVDWRHRRPAAAILEEVRARTADLAGIVIEVRKEDRGPQVGKPIQIELSSPAPDLLAGAVEQLRALLGTVSGLVNVTDTRPTPGLEWQMRVDREEASRFGVDLSVVGSTIRLVTNGIKVGGFRPDDADEEVEIRLRFPFGDRNIEQLDRLRVTTSEGAVPITNFVTREAVPRTGTIHRTDGLRVLKVEAEVGGRGAGRRQGDRDQERGRGRRARPAHRGEVQGRGRRAAQCGGVPAEGLRRRAVRDGDHPGYPVQQLLSGRPHSERGRAVHRRCPPRPARHGPTLRHRDERHRGDCSRRNRGQQQHRAHRHLQHPAARRDGRDRGGAAHRRAAPSSGAPHHRHHRARPDAHGAGREHRHHRTQRHRRRAFHPVVDPARDRGGRRTRLRHPADPGADSEPAGAPRTPPQATRPRRGARASTRLARISHQVASEGAQDLPTPAVVSRAEWPSSGRPSQPRPCHCQLSRQLPCPRMP